MLGYGLLSTLLGVGSELESFATAATGAVMATYYVGFLACSQIAPRILAHVGHVRVFAALASLASTAALIYALFVSPAASVAIRLVTGFCQAGPLCRRRKLAQRAGHKREPRQTAVGLHGRGHGRDRSRAASSQCHRLYRLSTVRDCLGADLARRRAYIVVDRQCVSLHSPEGHPASPPVDGGAPWHRRGTRCRPRQRRGSRDGYRICDKGRHDT